ncbi:semaphorin-5B-like isoform X1 [Sitophilus oryzae]|uniref:Semaphorin-5B-like isoform X1 n=1 Tax=Sitophilus oryzae TaxID=7048 RepID=A0A6J2X5T4_SITOR|nr:semaphorin-5B-like isoform X1 [Sitophilus oryzae]XP_030746275.1 semaphorin-5B-like isoform X1 [Sitophilus oryzae]
MVIMQLEILISIFLTSISSAVITNHDFRFISYKDLNPSVHWFPLDGVTAHSQMLFDVSRNQIFIGARDALYKLHLSKLELLEVAHWEATQDKITACISKGQDEENCHNFIKILLTNGNQIFACGTNAFSPLCSLRNIDNISNVTLVVNGIAKCPHNPAAKVTGFISDNSEYFFGGTTDFSDSDYLISKNVINGRTLRTKQYNSFWLNDPQFVGSFETSKFAYFLFRETAVEYINCGKVVYSRIGRVCKNDQGGHTMLKENWTTFVKARLNCSIKGDYPFYYNEIQSIHYVAEENIVYATFTTPRNSIAGSAICAFDMSAIDEAFNGPFKYQHDMDSAWKPHNVPHREHLECKISKYNNLLETSKYQLMDNAVQATTPSPLYTSNLERFTHITVDIVSIKHHRIPVLYVATEEALVKKLTIQHKQEACLVEIWQVASEYQPVIQNMQFLKGTSSVYATTDSGLIKINAAHCSRHSSKESCLNAMDPYCGWNELEDRCTTSPGTDRHIYWKQLINSCPILNTPINGGWSSWSEWHPCNYKTSAATDSDQCLCQTRQCNNPAPANMGLPCEGVAISVTNCTVHGGWTEWSPWSACSSSCGIAVKTRFRTCTNPEPAFGGRVCVGQDIMEASCDLPSCPTPKIDGGWSAWSSWSPCSASCDEGFKSRYRRCDHPVPQNEGHYCKGNDVEYSICNRQPCEDQRKQLHSEWITDYNISRKGYHQKRFRFICKAPVKHSNHIKIIVKEENQVCLSNKCDKEDEYTGWSSWSFWSECSASCGGGTQFRTRQCLKDNCLGVPTQTRDCNKHDCIDNWGCWTEWSPCNVSCGWGIKTRYRNCLGHRCKGADRQEESCQDQPCENILGWGNWTEWSECDQENLQYRKRTCFTENPDPYMCQGSSVQTRMCVGNQLKDDCSCLSVGLNMFFVGIIIGLTPGVLWLGNQIRIKKRKNYVPSSPHYITTANANPYVAIKRKSQLNRQNSHSGSSTLKSKLDLMGTLKRNSNDIKNGNIKAYHDSDNHLFE